MQERADFTHDHPTRIIECIPCGTLFQSPRPGNQAVRDGYAKERYGVGRLEQLYRSQLDSFRSKAIDLARRLPPRARILEVGSFVGGFLRAAEEAGLDALGVDPSEQLTAFCRGRGLAVERTTLEDFALRYPAPWDAICIWNTFDQVPEPGSLLRAAARLLAPQGTLIARVPNGAYYRKWALGGNPRRRRLRFPSVAWNNLAGFPYLNGYSLRSLDAVMAREGFARTDWHGSTLCVLADKDYRRWARLEEALCKTVQKALAFRRPEAAPWIDAYYRTTA